MNTNVLIILNVNKDQVFIIKKIKNTYIKLFDFTDPILTDRERERERDSLLLSFFLAWILEVIDALTTFSIRKHLEILVS